MDYHKDAGTCLRFYCSAETKSAEAEQQQKYLPGNKVMNFMSVVMCLTSDQHSSLFKHVVKPVSALFYTDRAI